MSVSVVVEHGCSTAGEGPHWDPQTNSLLYVDMLGKGSVHRWNADTGKDEFITLDDTVSFVIPTTKGDYLIGLGLKLARLDWSTKKVTVLHEVDHGTKNRFNDAKCDPSGRLWAGTMGFMHDVVKLKFDMENAHLYSLEKDGRLIKHLDKITISNGLAWSSDHKTMYYIDTIPHGARQVVAYDFDMEAGKISNCRVVFDYDNQSNEKTLGIPDGMCIDTEDKLWVACYGVGKVLRIDPHTGSLLREISIPVRTTTSCCFGGPNYDELFVTCTREGITDEEFAGNQCLAGSVFKVTGLGVKGMPVPIYEG